MSDTLDIEICKAEKHDIDAMAKIFVEAFDTNLAVKLMYTPSEILPTILHLLHSYMTHKGVNLKLAMKTIKDSKTMVGWMCFSTIKATDAETDFVSNDLSNLAALKLLEGKTDSVRYRLAKELEEASRKGQSENTPGNRIVINALVTDKDHRGLGAAKELLDKAVEEAEKLKYPI